MEVQCVWLAVHQKDGLREEAVPVLKSTMEQMVLSADLMIIVLVRLVANPNHTVMEDRIDWMMVE